MSNQTMKVQIGILVLGALLLLGTLIIMFGSIPGLFRSTNMYTVSFNDAPGVSSGAPVRRSGVRIGQVMDISLNDKTGKVLVLIAIEKSYRIRKYEQPTLITGLLGNDSSIDLVPKEGNITEEERVEIPINTEIAGIRAANVASLLNKASDIVPTTQEIMVEMSKSFQRLEKLAPEVDATLKEFKQAAKGVNELFPDLKKTLDEYASVARQYNRIGERVDLLIQANQDKVIKLIDQASEDLTRLGNFLNEDNQKQVNAIVKNLRKGSENIDQMAKNADEALKELASLGKKVNESFHVIEELVSDLKNLIQPFSKRSESLGKSLDEVLEKSANTLVDIRDMVRVIGQADGTFKRFLTDPSIYNNIDKAVFAVSNLTPRIDQILRDVGVFADKLARHPEALGIGGVVRPGSGLKDTPVGPTPIIIPSNR